MENMKKPFFFDSTLRDGNQALRKPWNLSEKEYVFSLLKNLGIQAVEVGFPGSCDMEFETCKYLSSKADEKIVVCGLARAVEKDINIVYDAIKDAPRPRIHTFIALSPFNMQYVLQKKPEEVKQTAIDAVRHAKALMGSKGDVQFSVEHFGDCAENMPFVIDTLQHVVEAGATTINLPIRSIGLIPWTS